MVMKWRTIVSVLWLLCASGAQAADYSPWQAQGDSIPEPLAGLQGDAGRGEQVLRDRRRGNCLACHQLPLPEEAFQGTLGPPLHGVGKRYGTGQLRLRVADMRRLNPDTLMPPFHADPQTLNRPLFPGKTFLAAQDIEDLVAYLATLKGPMPPASSLRHGEPLPPAEQRPVSGYALLEPDMQAMQDDEFENPGFMTVDAGRQAFHARHEGGGRCADCHGEDGRKFDPASIAAYPKWDEKLGRPLTLQARIRRCRQERLGRSPLPYDHPRLVALETFVRHLARGEPVRVKVDGPMRPHLEAGRRLWNTRFGIADFSCADCHDRAAGQYLRGQWLSQGQANGFPEYRLKTGKVTSLQTRFTQCLKKFYAKPFPQGSPEYRDLEIYVMSRGNGLAIETPAIRY